MKNNRSSVEYIPVATCGIFLLIIIALDICSAHIYYASGTACVIFIAMVSYFIRSRKRKVQTSTIDGIRKAIAGELTCAMIHEINQPLCIMRGNIELAMMQAKDSAPEKNNLGEALLAIDHLGDILAGLKKFADSKDRQIENFDVEDTLEYALDFIRSQLSAHSIKTVFEKHGAPFNVHGDKKTFVAVVLELLFGARIALDESNIQEKTIRISLENDDENIILQITAAPGTCSEQRAEHARILLETSGLDSKTEIIKNGVELIISL